MATGLFLGIATITKGTLYPTLLGLIIIAYFGYSRTWNWAKLGYIAAGFGVYLLLQLAHSQLSTGKMSLLPSNGGLSAYLGQMHVRSVTNRTNGGYTIFYNNNSYYDKTLTKDVVFYTPVWDQKPFIDAVIDLYRPVAHWPARNDSRTIPYDLAFQYVYIVLVYPLFVIGIVRSVITKDKLPEWAILLVLVVGVTITAGVTKGEERYLIPFSYYYFIGAAGALGRLANKRWG